MTVEDRQALEQIEDRLRTVLPEDYQDSYEGIQPVSMGSAGLKYSVDGRVAWNEMWATFCDLAMAGGPPHKGMLLEPASQLEIDRHPARYEEVVTEICRGASMVSDLVVDPSATPGWVRVQCHSRGMAGWLVRAIVMENVSARAEGLALHLPAGPGFRLEKEIKNVVTVIAKTTHYWLGHMGLAQRRAIADLLAKMTEESPLVEPAFSSSGGASADAHEQFCARVAEAIRRHTGLRRSSHRYAGWLGLECPSVRAAVWMMRTLVATNILSRREAEVLFVPINPLSDPNGETVETAVALLHRLATAKGVL